MQATDNSTRAVYWGNWPSEVFRSKSSPRSGYGQINH